jgi:hypothetical protein
MPIVSQGMFIGTGSPVTINLISGVNWMNVYNMTESAASNDSHGVSYYWQLGMTANDGIVTLRNSDASAVNVSTSAALTVGGFTYVDSSMNAPGVSLAFTSISNDSTPVVTVASTAGLATGDIIRIFNTVSGQQLGGIDFYIEVLNGTTFSLASMAQIAATGTGTYRIIPFPPLFYPRSRVIGDMISTYDGDYIQVGTTVPHGLTVGQQIRFVIPAAFGWGSLNQIQTTVSVVISNLDFVVNATAAQYPGTFTWPTTAQVPFTPAMIIPIGEAAFNGALPPAGNVMNANSLDDATVNTGFTGMQLASGITSPGGSTSDVVFWQAGVSDYVTLNQQ